MNAELEAFLNNEVGKMYANDTQKLMLYRVDADERESYGYKDMGQTERLGALLGSPVTTSPLARFAGAIGAGVRAQALG